MLSVVFAQVPRPVDFNTIDDALGPEFRFNNASLSSFFNLGIVNIVFFVAGVLLLFYIITSGLSMMTSRGDPKALEGAKARLTQAIIGFVIIFMAYWIVQIIGLLLGLDGFGGVFG
ncbi:hypothetical protein A2803_01475 [Candidatus Woesebacteria bacterium RIFCSPHIGHO2_01_FULL_44_21]|uniref:Uncharacterized protein n=1 Tax=Candidatus Woesebacteria bacterium RIFCSPHIGHO2_01_FULL_44_21 TaxID=1802503 RepID=A0A1F7YZC7_9BACT|nr:MAG: hypothetical protein A2803_01475 [Candidatus Woesebacteria bacterium RIFCSPHIGHO2_01_FULL_44_21]